MSILPRLINEQQFQITMGLPSEAVFISHSDFRALEVELNMDASSNFESIILMLFTVHANLYIVDGASRWTPAIGYVLPGRQVTYKPTTSSGGAISGNGLFGSAFDLGRGHTYVAESRAHTDASPRCRHEYKRYDGLLESFEYCVKCDGKRE